MITQIIFQRVTLSNNYKILLVIIYCILVLSCFSRVRLFETLWTVARQAPLSMEFSSQEHWSGLPFPPPGIFLTRRWNLHLSSPALAVRFFTTSSFWEAHIVHTFDLF